MTEATVFIIEKKSLVPRKSSKFSTMMNYFTILAQFNSLQCMHAECLKPIINESLDGYLVQKSCLKNKLFDLPNIF